jgi:hypothetical protein
MKSHIFEESLQQIWAADWDLANIWLWKYEIWGKLLIFILVTHAWRSISYLFYYRMSVEEDKNF